MKSEGQIALQQHLSIKNYRMGIVYSLPTRVKVNPPVTIGTLEMVRLQQK